MTTQRPHGLVGEIDAMCQPRVYFPEKKISNLSLVMEIDEMIHINVAIARNLSRTCLILLCFIHFSLMEGDSREL